ncbi:uncharacterized protein MELLADRAFT_76247 [Melampsora larici-populina 98AG31]|uniref:Uncharacterized protein n=1 Tax=Melampsora larici-populina (strain 98AG31 / pathotype 3-4-7) TaxID=747676 RepID=F4R3F0_MELLP|nr:uncharacterized protein MELLADRAFT_76247 [Melampsora larici-populina 98AG31]EGG13180.1 hypothetical protein MELLADRAFT_76247 [Melampsora larici-populina 98AG31]
MATTTTPAASMPKRQAFNRETKSLIDSLGGGVESMTPRSSRSARNSNPVSPLPSPGPSRSAFRVPSRRRISRQNTTDTSSSSSSQHHIQPSIPNLTNSPATTSPLAINQPAFVSTSALPNPDPVSQPLTSHSGTPIKRKRTRTKSSGNHRPGSDSSLSDLSDADHLKHPAKKVAHSQPTSNLNDLPLGSSSSSSNLNITVTDASLENTNSTLLAPQASSSTSLDPLHIAQSGLPLVDQPVLKAQRLILKPPMPKPGSAEIRNSKLPTLPIPKINLPPKSDFGSTKSKGKAKASQAPPTKGAKGRLAKPTSLRCSRSVSHTPRSRRLTEQQKQEIEQKRLKLLASLDEEEEMIRSSTHPLLVELQANIDRGRHVKLRQAHLKHEALKTYLGRQQHEQEQRVWATWADEKVRLRSELLVKCQIQLARAPFEFVMSNETSNLQAMFHLSPPPKLTPFVPNAACTISADSLVPGLERQRIKNHAMWYLPNTAIEADLALLRGPAKSHPIYTAGDQMTRASTQTKPTTSSNSTVIATTQDVKRSPKKWKSEHKVPSDAHTQPMHSLPADDLKILRQRPGVNPTRNESSPVAFSPIPSTSQVFATSKVAHTSEVDKGSMARACSDAKFNTRHDSRNDERPLSKDPRRRSSRQPIQNFDNSSEPASVSHKERPNKATGISADRAATTPSGVDRRGAVPSWASTKSTQPSATILCPNHGSFPERDHAVDPFQYIAPPTAPRPPHPPTHNHVSSESSYEPYQAANKSGNHTASPSLANNRDYWQATKHRRSVGSEPMNLAREPRGPLHSTSRDLPNVGTEQAGERFRGFYPSFEQYESQHRSDHSSPRVSNLTGSDSVGIHLTRPTSAPHHAVPTGTYGSVTSSTSYQEASSMSKSFSADWESHKRYHLEPHQPISHHQPMRDTTSSSMMSSTGSGGAMKKKGGMANYQPKTSSSLKMTNRVE